MKSRIPRSTPSLTGLIDRSRTGGLVRPGYTMVVPIARFIEPMLLCRLAHCPKEENVSYELFLPIYAFLA
jgi:hypothetical protein